MRPSRSRTIPILAALLSLAACGPPEQALVPPSRAAEAAPRPELVETARFREAQRRTDAAGLETGAAALAARAAALRARAGALEASVVGGPERARLDTAAREASRGL